MGLFDDDPNDKDKRYINVEAMPGVVPKDVAEWRDEDDPDFLPFSDWVEEQKKK